MAVWWLEDGGWWSDVGWMVAVWLSGGGSFVLEREEWRYGGWKMVDGGRMLGGWWRYGGRVVALWWSDGG